MEDDLPTEYDVVVVGTGIDFYCNFIIYTCMKLLEQ